MQKFIIVVSYCKLYCTRALLYAGWLYMAGCVALCYDCFSEKPKLSNVELG